MMIDKSGILTINGGSSSIKFALFEMTEFFKLLLSGELENIGTKLAAFNYHNKITGQTNNINIVANDYAHASEFLVDWLEKEKLFASVKAIGHRVVFGMEHTAPEIITPELLVELKNISAYDPEHLPEEIELMELFCNHYPDLTQVACFDTAFHTTLPLVAKMLGLPRKYYNKGIQRYGFHGLSYAFLIGELKVLDGEKAAQGKIILAHLGSGASLAAVKYGKSIDTTMAFTPSSGLPMGSRSGDIDPGVAWYLMKFEKMGHAEFSHLTNHESGLIGISETSSDMRELLEVQLVDKRAAEAIEVFCYQIKKTIGGYAAALCGLDTLVFSGGIGENSPEVRSRICDSMEFLGIELDKLKNDKNEQIISAKKSRVNVRVIKTNEELMIAKLVFDIVNPSIKQNS
jgi:acetate kinase